MSGYPGFAVEILIGITYLKKLYASADRPKPVSPSSRPARSATHDSSFTTFDNDKHNNYLLCYNNFTMATSREAPNPLRPYYIPPSIGFPPESTPAPSSSSPRGANAPSNGSTYASSARDIFGDMDYSDYVSDDNKSTLDMIRQMLDDAMYKYLAVLLAQPFDVAKTVLQVRSQGVLLDGTAATKGSKGAEGFVDSRFDVSTASLERK